MVLILSRAEVEQVLSMDDCIKEVRKAFIEYSDGKAIVPIRNVMDITQYNGISLYMPAYLSEASSMVCKIATVYENNPRMHNLPTLLSTVFLQDPETGAVKAIMDGTYLTAVRTGAASGVAISHLARDDSKTVGLFGAGVQARTQLWAATVVRDIEYCKVFDPNSTAVEAFVNEMTAKLGIQIESVSSNKEAVDESDIILTATTSPIPIFQGEWVSPGTHISAVGSFKPNTRELDTYTVKQSKVVIDSREACLEEAGELIIPIQNSIITEDHIHAELGEVASGKKAARETYDEITLFKSVGLAIQDAAAAKLTYTRAQAQGIGTEIKI